METLGTNDDTITIPADGVLLPGSLTVPDGARGVVVFAHGSGSSRLSPRNNRVAAELRASGHFGTLLFDLLTAGEDAVFEARFDIGLLTRRLVTATEWLATQPAVGALPVGYFGASTGAAAALQAAAELDGRVATVVSRGGRPDLAGTALAKVTQPTLLIVGGNDPVVIGLNSEARGRLHGSSELAIIPGATHLFEEPGAMEQVSRLTADWFERYLG